jgi:NEDD8-activating enzyme E1
MYNPMDDYMFYNGNEGIFSYTYKNARLDDCQHCCTIVPAVLAVDPKETLQDLIQRIPEVKVVKHHIGKPLGTSYSLVEGKTQHYNSMVPALEKATKGNLTKTLQELGIVTGDELLFTSEGWTKQYPFVVDFGDKDEIEE